jgi:hypothetical protein
MYVCIMYIFSMVQQPLLGQGLLIIKASWSRPLESAVCICIAYVYVYVYVYV